MTLVTQDLGLMSVSTLVIESKNAPMRYDYQKNSISTGFKFKKEN